MVPASIRKNIPALKREHGTIYLLDVTSFQENKLTSYMVIRPLTRCEFNSFISESEDYIQTKNVIDHCLLYGDLDKEHWLAGIDDYIYSAIISVSAFADEDALVRGVEQGRENASTLEAVITMFICKAFPSLSPIEVDKMTFEQQMKYAAMAETMLNKPIPYAEFFEESAQSRVQHEPYLPVPEGMQSYGPGANINPRLNLPLPQQDTHIEVTPENLHKVMRETQEIFSGRS